MEERLYKTVTQVGAGTLVLGIIALASGTVVGVLSIVSGARLLASRKHITF